MTGEKRPDLYAAEKHLGLDGTRKGDISSAPEVGDLAQVVWKYFEPDLREALLEAQASLAENNEKRTEQLTNGKQEGK